MTKEEIVKEFDELGNVLYNKFGTDSYLERCTIHDLKAKIKALIIADVSQQRELLIGYIMNEHRLYCGKPDRKLSEDLADDYIANL